MDNAALSHSTTPPVRTAAGTAAHSALTPLERVLLWVASLAIAAYSTSKFIQFFDWNLEDGYIIYRIVRNILAGNGWAYNVGEVHNASTSVLNTVAITLLGTTGIAIPIAAHLIGALSLAVTAFLTFRLFRSRGGVFPALLAALLAIRLLAHDATWGLETFLFTALVTYFVYVTQRGGNGWPVLGFAVLARPDALLLVGVKWLCDLITKRTLSIRGTVQFALVLAPWVLFSLYTFHQIFPDTLSNKVWQGSSGFWGQGWIYLKALKDHVVRTDWLLRTMFVLGALGTVRMVFAKSALAYLPVFGVLQQLAYCALNVPAYHWYFAFFDFSMLFAAADLAVTVIAVCRAVILPYLPRLLEATVNVVAVGALTFHAGTALAHASRDRITDSGNGHYEAAVRTINSLNLPPGTLAVVEVGTLGYGIDRPILDMVGLSSANPELLSGKHNDVFFAKAPLIVITHNPVWGFEQAIVNDLRFAYFYGAPTPIAVPHTALNYYVRQKEIHEISREELVEFVRSRYPAFVRGAAPGAAVVLEEGCILDSINRQLAQRKTTRVSRDLIEFEGWAVNRSEKSLSKDVVIALEAKDGARFEIRSPRVPRPDVAQYLQRPEFNDAGYRIQASILDIPPGRYRVKLMQEGSGSRAVCEVGKEVEIR